MNLRYTGNTPGRCKFRLRRMHLHFYDSIDEV
jgi:hypothetical protein